MTWALMYAYSTWAQVKAVGIHWRDRWHVAWICIIMLNITVAGGTLLPCLPVLVVLQQVW
jgi:hypothetical protein